MKLQFSDIIDKYTDRSAIVVGCGPSLNSHINKISDLCKNDKYIVISCNDIDIIAPSINMHYWVLANSIDTVGKIYQRINAKHATLVYADVVDRTPREIVDKKLKVDYLPYDQRHIDGHAICGAQIECCNFAIPGRLTIREEVQKYTKYNQYYSAGRTVAVHMLALSILLGCKNIYITGVDLDYKKGYAGGHFAKRARNMMNKSESFTNNLAHILKDMEILNDSANNIKSNIYCLDKNIPISKIFSYSNLP